MKTAPINGFKLPFKAAGKIALGMFALLVFSTNTLSEQADTEKVLESDPNKPVAVSVEELKKKVIKLNRDLFILEEDLLFPANTQFSVFVSMDTGQFFKPDSITLKLNDEVIASHLYTQRQILALSKGGMQRLHMGNLKTGQHELTAVLWGAGTDGRDVKRAATLQFEKASDIASFEVKIKDQSADYQAELEIVQWDN